MDGPPRSLAGLAERWPRWRFSEVVVRGRGKPRTLYRARCGAVTITARRVERLAALLLAEELWNGSG
jgi:hypothetical protein